MHDYSDLIVKTNNLLTSPQPIRETLPINKTSPMAKLRKIIRSNLLTILTITGVVLGIALGAVLRVTKKEWSPREISYVALIGDLFLNMLKGLILPLIISSLITAVGSLDISVSKKIGGRGIAFYMATTVLAIVLGIVLAVTIKPGKKGPSTEDPVDKGDSLPSLAEDTILDLIRNMFAPNLIQATLQHHKTEFIVPNGTEISDVTPELARTFEIKGVMEDGTNIMGLVVFAAVLGIAIGKLGEQGKPLLNFFQSLSDASMMITGWVIWLTPVGVPFLVASSILDIEELDAVVTSLGLYFGTVLAGLFIHGVIVLPLIFFIMTRKAPFRYTGNMVPAILTAFGTGSSSATLPITIKCLEENNNVDPRVSRFLLPIGATINMDGTALYEAVAAIFIAQLHGMDLGIGKIIAISVTATAASIGAAGIPQAGLVTMVMVLNTIGLPGSYISYIIPVDWLLDRFRTAINVLGDSFGAGIINHICKDELLKMQTQVPESEEKPIESVETGNGRRVSPTFINSNAEYHNHGYSQNENNY